MLTRRRFRPSLDCLSERIAPTAGAGLMGAALVAAHAANVVPATPMDNQNSDPGTSGTGIVGEPTPPPTLNC